MSSSPDISIIIPVYNAKKYLNRCIDSILNSLDKILGEILLVDNDSTDDSLAIIKSLKKKYPDKISVLHCHIPGASASRNLGAKHAKGRYLWFVDADDSIMPEAIPKLIQKAQQKKSDLIMLGADCISQNQKSRYLPAIDARAQDFKSKFVRYGLGPWQVLIRRSWWNKHNFTFQPGIIHEDMELMSALILYTDNYSSIDEPLYNYYENTGSVLHKKSFNPHIFDIFPALKGLYQRFQDANAEKLYYSELEWFFIWNLLIDSAQDFAKHKKGKPGFKRSRKLLKQYFPHWTKNQFLKQKPLKLRARVFLNYLKP